MKEIGDLDEKTLWEKSFPYTSKWCASRGVYTLPDRRKLLEDAMCGSRPADPVDAALFKVELACACLWPRVRELFNFDVFPHVLACATDLLRAVDFGENCDEQTAQLADELSASLDNFETHLAMLVTSGGCAAELLRPKGPLH